MNREEVIPYVETLSNKFPRYTWRNVDYHDGIQIPIGVHYTGELYCINLNEVKHIVLTGAAGSGKGNMLSNMLTSLALLYKTSDLNIWLLDTDDHVYGEYCDDHACLIPNITVHCTYVNDFRVHLDSLLAEISKRENILLKTGNKSWSEVDHNQYGADIVIFVDEFQQCLNYPVVMSILNRVLHVGSNLGIHLVFSSQANCNPAVHSEVMSIVPHCGCKLLLRCNESAYGAMSDGVPFIQFESKAGIVHMIINHGDVNKRDILKVPYSNWKVHKDIVRSLYTE